MSIASDIQQLSALATKRMDSVFATDMVTLHDRLTNQIAGKRILVIGAGGSIGAATTECIVGYGPACLHLIDQSENSLVEMVRHLRSRSPKMTIQDFKTYAIDYASPYAARVLEENQTYDTVLNFSAIKHVRSEGSLASLIQMFDTNLIKNLTFMIALRDRGFTGRYFCVSTDKAANPVSLMGASKRIMEHLIFSAQTLLGFNAEVSTARFANVAFSNGSLLESFVRRLEKRQPLAVPRAVERYFVSPNESGEICTLAAFGVPKRSIVVPNFESKISLVLLEDVARDFLRHRGFDPIELDDEDAARAAVPQNGAAKGYPLLLTPLDTSGEKPYEEFVGQGEQLVELGLSSVAAVGYTGCDIDLLKTVLWALKAAAQGDRMVNRDMLIGLVSDLVPQFKYIPSDSHLDQRM